ncbi:hypothetical protein [Rickettsia endosymbiont of Proechinophthirus fluctus]|uniref:hypothetical protein n=1 Tax=Rickettsia endosymbiont of Proechinophthirus fluctus TaxID=1462733 RepID=UPI0020938196|nr:hypothetical protein [Rickettsia endosymbiont of Proechinophthirus fluctus]
MFRCFQPSNQELIRTIQKENTAKAQKLIAAIKLIAAMGITELSKVRDIYISISRAICSIRTYELHYRHL